MARRWLATTELAVSIPSRSWLEVRTDDSTTYRRHESAAEIVGHSIPFSFFFSALIIPTQALPQHGFLGIFSFTEWFSFNFTSGHSSRRVGCSGSWETLGDEKAVVGVAYWLVLQVGSLVLNKACSVVSRLLGLEGWIRAASGVVNCYACCSSDIFISFPWLASVFKRQLMKTV